MFYASLFGRVETLSMPLVDAKKGRGQFVSRYEVPNFAFCRDRETARMAAAEDEVAHFDAIVDRRTADRTKNNYGTAWKHFVRRFPGPFAASCRSVSCRAACNRSAAGTSAHAHARTLSTLWWQR